MIFFSPLPVVPVMPISSILRQATSPRQLPEKTTVVNGLSVAKEDGTLWIWSPTEERGLVIDPQRGAFHAMNVYTRHRHPVQAVIRGTGEATLSDGTVWNTADARTHDVGYGPVNDKFGRGVVVTVRHLKGARELRQTFWVYRDRKEILTRLDAVGFGATNRIVPIANATIEREDAAFANRLEVPYDNDGYNRYHSDGRDGRSHGVTSFYDDDGPGFVVGAIDHDVWKSGITFPNPRTLNAVAGMTENGRDKVPHGALLGTEIRSPRFSIGYYDDWRDGMERYGDLNALVREPLAWTGGVPFGWNSWAAHKEKLSFADANAATDFLHTGLPEFRNDGTAYVNLDSFWDNMTRAQRKQFVRRAHVAGLRAGTYWTPFVAWGGLEDRVQRDRPVLYRDLALKDVTGTPLPKLDGGWPLDPTHPETLARIDRQMREFVEDGFDFVKLDFTTHGALEAVHHDERVRTGNEAYTIGMRRIAAAVARRKIGRPFFISLSIAPLFPHGLGHSRRVSCDAFADIGASEYLMNSSTYGWWTEGRLYRFNDPDHTVVYRALGEKPTTEAEARTRMTASVVSGGMMLQGDALGEAAVQARVRSLFTNREVLDLARKARAFRPVDTATGERAGEALMLRDGEDVYVALFNYEREKPLARTIPLDRLGLSGLWTQRDLWNGESRPVAGELVFTLPARDCALVRLTKRR